MRRFLVPVPYLIDEFHLFERFYQFGCLAANFVHVDGCLLHVSVPLVRAWSISRSQRITCLLSPSQADRPDSVTLGWLSLSWSDMLPSIRGIVAIGTCSIHLNILLMVFRVSVLSHLFVSINVMMPRIVGHVSVVNHAQQVYNWSAVSDWLISFFVQHDRACSARDKATFCIIVWIVQLRSMSTHRGGCRMDTFDKKTWLKILDCFTEPCFLASSHSSGTILRGAPPPCACFHHDQPIMEFSSQQKID